MTVVVPLADLERIVGSGDETILADVKKRCAGDVERLGPDALEGLGAIVDGVANVRARAPQYGYGLELACRMFGEPLDNGGFMPSSLDWVKEVDVVLRAQECRFAVEDLALGRPPIRIPAADDFPSIGTVGPDTIAAARAPDPEAGPEKMRPALREVAAWIVRAQTLAAEDPSGRWALVGFWY
jgi:hypothetical protein